MSNLFILRHCMEHKDIDLTRTQWANTIGGYFYCENGTYQFFQYGYYHPILGSDFVSELFVRRPANRALHLLTHNHRAVHELFQKKYEAEMYEQDYLERCERLAVDVVSQQAAQYTGYAVPSHYFYSARK